MQKTECGSADAPVRLELSLIRVQTFKTFARGAAPD